MFHLGEQAIDPARCTILRGTETIRVEPRVMDVLLLLVEHAQQVVPREEFINTVWRGTFVSDEVLSRCIYRLRQALGDNPREPRFVETVPKRGYRLIAPVHRGETGGDVLPVSPANPPLPAGALQSDAVSGHHGPARRQYPYWIVPLAAVGILLVVYLFRLSGPAVDSPPARVMTSIAVLPFVNMSDSSDNDYVGDGIAEELIGLLTKVPDLKVVARTSSFEFRGKAADVRRIAGRLGVANVLEGSVQVEGSRIRVSARLVDASTAYHLWAETFDTQFEDVFTVQDQIAGAIVRALKVSLDTGDDVPKITARTTPTTDMTAYRLYLQGLYHWKRRGEPSIRKSIELFRGAIERDPAFVYPYQALSSAYLVLPYYSRESRLDAFARAEAAAKSALELDPTLGKAHAVLAFISMNRWDWTAAQRQFELAIDAAPNDATTHQWYSEFLSYVGYTDASVTEALRALELDPVSPVINDRLGVTYLWSGEYELAAEQFRSATELGIDRVAIDQAYALLLLRTGRIDDAVTLYETILGKLGFDTAWVRPVAEATGDSQLLPSALEALAHVRAQGSLPDAMLFYAAVLLRQPDMAFGAVESLIAEKSLTVEFLFSPEAAELRRDPRFPGLLAAIGLDAYWDQHGWPAFCKRQPGTISCT